MNDILEKIKNKYQVVLEGNDEFVVHQEAFFDKLTYDRYYINKIDSANCSTTYLFAYKSQPSAKNKKLTTGYIPESMACVRGNTLFSHTNLPELTENFFSLAQAYREKNPEKSLEFFKKACHSKNKDEAFLSQMHLGTLAASYDEAIRCFIKAWEINKNRAESLWLAAMESRKKQYWDLAYLFAKTAIRIPKPEHGMLVQNNCYNWGVRDELSIAAFWTNRHTEARDEIYKISSWLPETEIERVRDNLESIEDKLQCNKDRPRVFGQITTQSAKVIAKLALDVKSILVVSDDSEAMQLAKRYASHKADILGVTTNKQYARSISDALQGNCPEIILHSEFLENQRKFDLIIADHSSVLFHKLFWNLWHSLRKNGKLLLTNDLFRVYNTNWALVLDDIKAIQPNYSQSDYTLVTTRNLWKLKSNHGLEAWEYGEGEPPTNIFD